MGASITELQGRKRRYETKIEKIEKEIIEEEKAQGLRGMIKIECERCDGTGSVTMGGADLESDPPYELPCDDCGGEGYTYMRPFKDKIDYYREGEVVK